MLNFSATSGARARIPNNEFRALIDDVRGRHLLSEIIGRHTTLKRRGEREQVGICPFHSERTPSFEVNDAKGRYYCHGCGAGGDAFKFLINAEGMTFRQAFETLSGNEFASISDDERAKRKADDLRATTERLSLAQSICARIVDPVGTPAEVYLRSRGIVVSLPASVGFVMTPRWRNAETGEIGRDHPALAFVATDVAGAVAGVQCVFLADGGHRKYAALRPDGSRSKAKLSFGLIAGSAIRLGGTAETVVVCEGPEDGLTLMQELRRPVWVAAGTSLLPRMQFPPTVESIEIARDNDDAGEISAEEAERSFIRRGLRVRIIRPGGQFKDFNDQLLGRTRT